MNKPPKWFTIVAVVALLWNLLGCLAFAMDLMLTAEDIAKMPEAQQALYEARPGWSLIATALAVLGGALGCVGLLIRKRWALHLFAISLLGIGLQDMALFVLVDGAGLAGPGVVAMQAMVLVIAIGLLLLSLKGIAREWLT